MSERSVAMYDVYTEFGHQGSREQNTSYTLTLSGVGLATVAALEIEVTRNSFPDVGDSGSDTERYRIEATKIVDFIRSHGTKVP